MNETGTEASFDREWEDVSLGRYVRVLVAWWREIGLGTVLAAVGSGALILAIQVILPMYETASDVAIVRTAGSVSLDKKFSTGGTSGDRPRIRDILNETMAKRAALVGIVKSGGVAQLVAERLSGELDEEEANAARLIERIDAELVAIGTLSIRNPSNLIRITASADSPEKAVLIANAWAEEYVEHVNRLYRRVPLTQLDEIVAEEKRTKDVHDAAQKRLETFVANDAIEKFELRIQAKRKLVSDLYDLWEEMINASMASLLHDQETKGEVIRLLVEHREEKLAENYEVLRKLERLLSNARGLRSQIENGGKAGVSSNGLALMMLKSQVYAPSTGLLGALEIRFDHVVGENADLADQLTEADALIAVVQQRIKEIRTMLAKQNAVFSSRITGTFVENGGKDDSDLEKAVTNRLLYLEELEALFTVEGGNNYLNRLIDKLEREIQVMKAESETAKATLVTLVQDRDVHRSALETLQNEIVELRLAMSAVTSEVRLASRALVPVDSAYPSAPLLAVLGGIVGLLAAVCLAFFANSEGVRPLLEKRRTARSDQNRDAG